MRQGPPKGPPAAGRSSITAARNRSARARLDPVKLPVVRTPLEIPEAVERWRAEAARLFLISHVRARGAARQATVEARKLPPGRQREAGTALALEARAVAEHAAGRYGRAAELYRRASLLYDRLALVREGARVRKNRVDALQYVNRIPEALREGRRAVRAFERLRDRAGLARALMNLAILEQRRDRPARALELYSRARRLFAKLDDASNLALSALNEAVARTSVDDFRRALELFEEARAQYTRAGLDMPVAETDFNESWVRALLGDFRRALELLDRAREVFVRMKDTVRTAVLDLDRAETLLMLNRAEDASRVIESALPVFRREKMLSEAGRALSLAGEAHTELEQPARAARELAFAIRSLEESRNLGGAARARLAMARLEIARGRYRMARAGAARAAKWFGASRLGSMQAASELLVAESWLALDRSGRALAILDRLARRAGKLPAATVVRVHHLRGRALAMCGRSSVAYRSLLRSIDAIERVRGAVPGTLMRSGWLADKVEVYEEALALCLDRRTGPDVRGAFLHAEQGRARTLADRLGAAEPPRARTAPARALLNRYRKVREEVRWLSGRSHQEGDGARGGRGSGARLRAALRRREAALAALLPRLQSVDEGVASFIVAKGVTAEEVCRELEPGRALVEYLVRENETVAFVLEQSGVDAVRIPVGLAVLEGTLRELHFHWDRFLLGEEYTARHRREILEGAERALSRIHRAIFEPLETRLDGRRLIIVPSGPLHDVPFGALLGPGGYVADRHEITLAPSASAWRNARRRARGRRTRFGRAPRALVMGLGAEELAHAPAECLAVARALPGAVCRVGPQATLEAFRRLAPSADVIHLAAHGVFQLEDPLLSSIQLADASVNLHELFDLALSARLVVLSGCQTALSRLSAGEETIGLSQGFLHAGAAALLVSLWSVNDPSTTAFMSRFYERLAAGDRPAAALRETMITHRETHPHPYYWAPFVLIGGD